jgi:general secretion pathway protein N
MRSVAVAAAIALCLAPPPAFANRDGERVGVTAALERAAPAGDGSAPFAPTTEDQGAPDTVAPTPAPPQHSGNPLWGIPLRTLSATRERPLFSPSRRPSTPVIPSAPSEPPPAPAAFALAPLAPERPQMTLVGTIVGAQARYALLQDDTTHLVDRVREGDTEGGWFIRTVLARSIVVEKGPQSVTLDLPDPSAAASTDDSQSDAAPAPRPAAARTRDRPQP